MPIGSLSRLTVAFARSTAFSLAQENIPTLGRKGAIAEERINYTTSMGDRVPVIIQADITDGSLGVFCDIGKTTARVPVRSRRVELLKTRELINLQQKLGVAEQLQPDNKPDLVLQYPEANSAAREFIISVSGKTRQLVVKLLREIENEAKREAYVLDEGLKESLFVKAQLGQQSSLPKELRDFCEKSSLKVFRKEDFNKESSFELLTEMKLEEFIHNIAKKSDNSDEEIAAMLKNYGASVKSLGRIYFVYDSDRNNVLIYKRKKK